MVAPWGAGRGAGAGACSAGGEDGVLAYAGFPVTVDGQIVGALCAFDGACREWDSEQLDSLERLSRQTETVLRGRAAVSH